MEDELMKTLEKNSKEPVIVPVDACTRPIQIPSRFIPYLEKHRIYELMHHLATDLVIKLPKDHIKCIKDSLDQIQMGRDHPQIILISPPYIDKRHLAELISCELNITLFSLNDVIEAYASNDFSKEEIPTEIIAETAVKILQSHLNKGWIFYDIPRNRTEAYALQRAGFLPTHTLHFIAPSLYDAASQYKKINPDLSESECFEKMKMFRRHTFGIRHIFQSTVKEIIIDGRDLNNLAYDAAQMCHIFRHLGPPMLPRIIVIGTRGSGRRVLSQALANRFHLILVNFEVTITQALEEDTVFGDRLREITREGLEQNPELIISIIEQRVTQWDCLDNGWVLFGYPRTADELILMDLIDTSPNRVIILDTPIDVCIERLTSRCFNQFTGEIYQMNQLVSDNEYQIQFNKQNKMFPICPLNMKSISNLKNPSHLEKVSGKQVAIQPKDYEETVYREVTEQFSYLDAIRTYCGRSATILNGSQSCQHVFERASAAVIQMTPAAPPRDPNSESLEENDINDGTRNAVDMLLAKKLPNNRYRWARSDKLPDDRNAPLSPS